MADEGPMFSERVMAALASAGDGYETVEMRVAALEHMMALLAGDSPSDGETTGRQMHALLESTYGYLDAARVLVDGRGNADFLACHLVEWILDWYRPSCDGKPRFHGRLELPTAWLAEHWNVGPRQLRTARERARRAGLITLHTWQHRCWVEVHWGAVKDALEASNARLESLLGPRGGRAGEVRVP